MAPGHAQQGMLGAQHRPDHVGLHHLEQTKLGHVLHPALLADGPGVVDQRGDRPELLVDTVEQPHHFVFDTGVGAHGNSLGPQRADLRQYLLGGLVIGVVVDAYVVTLLRRQQRGGGAYAPAGAGDDDDLVHEPAK